MSVERSSENGAKLDVLSTSPFTQAFLNLQPGCKMEEDARFIAAYNRTARTFVEKIKQVSANPKFELKFRNKNQIDIFTPDVTEKEQRYLTGVVMMVGYEIGDSAGVFTPDVTMKIKDLGKFTNGIDNERFQKYYFGFVEHVIKEGARIKQSRGRKEPNGKHTYRSFQELQPEMFAGGKIEYLKQIADVLENSDISDCCDDRPGGEIKLTEGYTAKLDPFKKLFDENPDLAKKVDDL